MGSADSSGKRIEKLQIENSGLKTNHSKSFQIKTNHLKSKQIITTHNKPLQNIQNKSVAVIFHNNNYY